jgi:histidine triad (HIT) family protein
MDFFLCYNACMNDCLFCSIANGDPANLVWQNDVAAAFKDIHPKAPIHLLIVPKVHVEKLDDLEDMALAGKLLMAVREVANSVGLKGRFRVALNNGRPAGQVIDHLHFHLLGTTGPEPLTKGDMPEL